MVCEYVQTIDTKTASLIKNITDTHLKTKRLFLKIFQQKPSSINAMFRLLFITKRKLIYIYNLDR